MHAFPHTRRIPTSVALLWLWTTPAIAQGGQDLATLEPPLTAAAESALAERSLDGKLGPMAKVGGALAGLYRAHHARAGALARRVEPPALAPLDPLIRTADGRVMIDATAAQSTDALGDDLAALGFVETGRFGRVISGSLPVDALASLAEAASLRIARPVMATTSAGRVTSEGDAALNADRARAEEEVRGRRVTVGVLSDSYDCLGGAARDIATRDLPRARRIVVLDDTACPASDEGRAMMQLVRDVAPRARQAFHTAFNGQASFARGIVELREKARADVIVDDVIYFAEPMFQDGIIAQAVDRVRASGAAYFSSSGNGARNSWESGSSGFVPSGRRGVFGGERHDFDRGPGIDDLQSVLIGTGTTIFAFQWDEPFASVSGAPGSASDVDIVLYLPSGIFIGIGGFDANIGGDAVEVFGVVNSGPPLVLEIGIELFEGPAPGFMKYVIFDPRVETIGDPETSFVVEHPTDSPTSYGHANAAGAAAVGAAYWGSTPRFGVFPPVVENFSSAGGVPILFDASGTRIDPEIRAQPSVVGPDGGATTFFGGRDPLGNTEPGGTSFFGTSAAAPHVAGVAALVLEANRRLAPDDVYAILERTAVDMDDPATPGFDVGFDFGTGHGLVDALAAVEEAEDFDDDDDDDEDDDDDDDDDEDEADDDDDDDDDDD